MCVCVCVRERVHMRESERVRHRILLHERRVGGEPAVHRQVGRTENAQHRCFTDRLRREREREREGGRGGGGGAREDTEKPVSKKADQATIISEASYCCRPNG